MLAPVRKDIDRLFKGNTIEEIIKSLEDEGTEWATKHLHTLSKMVSVPPGVPGTYLLCYSQTTGMYKNVYLLPSCRVLSNKAWSEAPL